VPGRGRRAVAAALDGHGARRGPLRARPAPAPRRQPRCRDHPLARGSSSAARELDLQAAGVELRGPHAAGSHRRVRRLLDRRRQGDRRRELLPPGPVLSRRKSLRLLALSFAIFGTFWGAWAVAAVDVERFLGLSHTGLGVMLAGAVVAGAAVDVVGGALVERWGTATGLAASLAAWGGLAVVLAATRSPGA